MSSTAGSNPDLGGNGISGSSNISLGNDALQSLAAMLAGNVAQRGTDIATASTLDFTAVAVTTKSLVHDLTGTTTVTAVTLTSGNWRICRAQGAFQLTASATLVVNGSTSANYTTTAGDLLVFFGYGSSTVRVWTFTGGVTAAATASALGTVNLTNLGIAYNVGLAASVGSSALTVSLKGADGNDPSATNPVYIPFRNATLATGTPVLRAVTAATSIVVASTKTMGTSNGVAFRLWVVAVDTGSGIELGLVNALSGTSIMSLASSDLYSPTATPGNSAQVIYTTSGQTSKPICVLGYLDFSSGEATAGTWATAPDRIQVRNLGTKLPGDVVQTTRTDTGAQATGTTQIPQDDTIPQNTEGTQFMSLAITPRATTNLLNVAVQGMYVTNTDSSMAQALFQDSTASAVSAIYGYNGASHYYQFNTSYRAIASTVSTTTFKVRAGPNAGATTVSFNGTSGARLLGGAMNSYMQIDEIMG